MMCLTGVFPSCGPPPRATHNQQILQVQSCLRRPLVCSRTADLLKKEGSYVHSSRYHPLINVETIRDRHPDMPSTEEELSMYGTRLRRRDRKSSVFLAFSDVEVSTLLPCHLNGRRSFSFRRDPLSVSVGGLPKVLPWSYLCRVALQLECRLRQLHSPGATLTNLPRRIENAHHIQLVSKSNPAITGSSLHVHAD